MDGFELREVHKSNLSSQWIRDDYARIPAREWIEDVRVRINALPSAMRTSRGSRRAQRNVNCRARCGVPETTSHIIQQCRRTHGGRIRRHDNIVTTVATALRRRGADVKIEEIFNTSEGLRKPDLVVRMGGRVVVLDCQIVSGGRPLSVTYEQKRRYYADNVGLVQSIATAHNVEPARLKFGAITISWRGVWAKETDAIPRSLGLPVASMAGLTTRVLQGSHLNFARWNHMTTMV